MAPIELEASKKPTHDVDHHEGDEDEYFMLPEAVISLDAGGAKITVKATGETAVHDVQILIDKAIEAVSKLQTQMQ